MTDLTACDLYNQGHAVQCTICQYRWTKILEINSVQPTSHFSLRIFKMANRKAIQ